LRRHGSLRELCQSGRFSTSADWDVWNQAQEKSSRPGLFQRSLLEGAARVPFLMAGAGLPAGKVIDTPVSHMDLAATLLALAGAPRPTALRGTSLLPLIAGDSNEAPGYVYSECHNEGNCTGSFMIRKGQWKYIYFSFYDNNLLFNLRDDPGELNNLAGRPETASIEREMHDALTSLVDPDSVTLRAFEKQEQVLTRLVQDNDARSFYETVGGRLGQGQAALLAQKFGRTDERSRTGQLRCGNSRSVERLK
jgi:arylsulfatase A-like enzyme